MHLTSFHRPRLRRSVAVTSRVLVVASLGIVSRTEAASLTGIGIGPAVDPIGAYSVATGISDDGNTVSAYNGSHAFKWSAGVTTPLGDLPSSPIGSWAQAISGDGTRLVGNSATDSGDTAFLWDAGTLSSLGSLDGGSYFSQARAISRDGSTIVGTSSSSTGDHGFRVDAGVMTPLSDLPGTTYAAANGVSGDGTIVVGQSNVAGVPVATRWNGSSPVALPDLPGSFSGIDGAWAYGISDDGSTIVGTGYAADGEKAVAWQGGTVLDLGDLAGGNVVGRAEDASNNGDVVVGTSLTDQGFEAFVWSSGTGMRRLWDVLVDGGLDPSLDGWVRLDSVNAISPDGRYLAGAGYRNGTMEGFIADLGAPISNVVPESSTWGAVAGVASLALPRVLRRRRPTHAVHG